MSIKPSKSRLDILTNCIFMVSALTKGGGYIDNFGRITSSMRSIPVVTYQIYFKRLSTTYPAHVTRDYTTLAIFGTRCILAHRERMLETSHRK
jgi:hypothetical protein